MRQEPFYSQKYLRFNDTIPLVKYLPKIKESSKRNLLTDDIPLPEAKKTADEEKEDDGRYYMYFKKELYLYVIFDNSAYQTSDGIPIQIKPYMRIDHQTNSYYPMTYLSDYWVLKKDLVMVNSTLAELNLTLHFNTYSLQYMIIQKNFEEQWKT